ncbi:hypothetical protein ABH940_003371 [Streptacidiphilus sp. BW17]|uniref:hypothetical protein n=1 Tax=Streptacidiphilus sp. BW17 TaxID=3156274 RepID=UPI003512F410
MEVRGTPARREQAAAQWLLELHWQQKGLLSEDTEAALPTALTDIREHFDLRGRAAPAALELLDRRGERMLLVDPVDPADR